jgi:hypothetical protein
MNDYDGASLGQKLSHSCIETYMRTARRGPVLFFYFIPANNSMHHTERPLHLVVGAEYQIWCFPEDKALSARWDGDKDTPARWLDWTGLGHPLS